MLEKERIMKNINFNQRSVYIYMFICTFVSMPKIRHNFYILHLNERDRASREMSSFVQL